MPREVDAVAQGWLDQERRSALSVVFGLVRNRWKRKSHLAMTRDGALNEKRNSKTCDS